MLSTEASPWCDDRSTVLEANAANLANALGLDDSGSATRPGQSANSAVAGDLGKPVDAADVDALWAQAQQGNELAYRQALHALAKRLRAFLRRRLQNTPQEAEDLLQESLLAMHLQRASHSPQVPVQAWAVAIARHKLIDHWRRIGRRDALHDPYDEVDESQLAAAQSPVEAQHDLAELMSALPSSQRQAIELTKIEGLSMQEASARTGHSVAALKVQVHRGLQRMAKLVQTQKAGAV